MPMLRENDTARADSRDPDTQLPDSAPIAIRTPSETERWRFRRLSEESIRTELCEGPIPDSPPRPVTPPDAISHTVSDRAELIERLKRGESPTWVPNRHLDSLFHQDKRSSPPRTPQAADSSASSSLLPAPTITPERQDATQDRQTMGSPSCEGRSIERPRSALHSGNFTPVELSPGTTGPQESTILRGSESRFLSAHTGWMSTSPPRDHAPFNFAHGTPSYRREAFKSGASSLSSSLSSSFAFHPPTSPLVQSESNEDLDLTLPLDSFKIDANSPRNTRRHTLNLGQSPLGDPTNHRQSPLRRESTYPYQAHQPRRSLHSTPSLPIAGISPQTPAFYRSRRPSLGSEASPLHHASMVGSYEESILRGRMSTTPSKPLEFTAQIGVLGLGKCKASLRCPAHVSLPFSAVFYNYPSTSSGGSKLEEGPSPYVGQIDLENGLPNQEEGQRARRKMQSRYQDLKSMVEEGSLHHDGPAELSDGEGASRATKTKRPSRTLRSPPGGGYRIPEKGQLQIIIKNQNKTAVKLFLVPYDLAGMEPGTKTFIRQRSYSAGPIVEAEVPKDGPVPGPERPILRYLIHLHICCPSKGRFYLYKSIRVVFANRVPDGKEKLRNEVTYPDPRFTPYKPTRVMHPPFGTSHVAGGVNLGGISPSAAALATERAFRRRSAGFSFGQGHHPLSQDQYHQHFENPFGNSTFTTPAHQPTNASFWKEQQTPPRDHSHIIMPTATATAILTAAPPTARVSARPGQEISETLTDSSATTVSFTKEKTYNQPSEGGLDHGNGKGTPLVAASTTTTTSQPPVAAAESSSAAAAEGLLSKRLRSLGVKFDQLTQQQPGQEQKQKYPLH
ncbi:hypothetical protein VTI28DRAFT_2092 [Corynascus sepedonium]